MTEFIEDELEIPLLVGVGILAFEAFNQVGVCQTRPLEKERKGR